MYRIGKCKLCGQDIVRRQECDDDAGRTISFICSCPPKYEKMFAVVESGIIPVFEEKDGENE